MHPQPDFIDRARSYGASCVRAGTIVVSIGAVALADA
jgi:hypothetical protein